MVFSWVYHPEFGIMNYGLSLLGIDGPNWLGDPRSAMPALMLMSIWKGLGYSMVIYLAGLQAILGRGYRIEDFAYIIPHQANIRMFQHIARSLKIPFEKFYLTLHKYGNISSASCAIALDEAVRDGSIQSGILICLPVFGDLACLALVLDDEEVVAGSTVQNRIGRQEVVARVTVQGDGDCVLDAVGGLQLVATRIAVDCQAIGYWVDRAAIDGNRRLADQLLQFQGMLLSCLDTMAVMRQYGLVR